MRERSDLFLYQRQAIAAMLATRQLACFLEPGWGKTVITLTALDDLFCSRVLVLAPAMVAKTNVWGREAARWKHLQNTVVRPLVGSESERLAILRDPLPESGDMVLDVVSYENFLWLTEHIDFARYDAIIIDELSKMKHPGTKRFRRFRNKAMKIPVRFGLTGTPVGNQLEDIWGEMFAVCGEKPLGPTKGEFLAKHFYPVKVAQNAQILEAHAPRCPRGASAHQALRLHAEGRGRPGHARTPGQHHRHAHAREG